MDLGYTTRKYIIDTLKINYDYNFEGEKLLFFNKKGTKVDFESVIIFLKKEHELELQDGNDVIIEWTFGSDMFTLLEFGALEG